MRSELLKSLLLLIIHRREICAKTYITENGSFSLVNSTLVSPSFDGRMSRGWGEQIQIEGLWNWIRAEGEERIQHQRLHHFYGTSFEREQSRTVESLKGFKSFKKLVGRRQLLARSVALVSRQKKPSYAFQTWCKWADSLAHSLLLSSALPSSTQF